MIFLLKDKEKYYKVYGYFQKFEKVDLIITKATCKAAHYEKISRNTYYNLLKNPVKKDERFQICLDILEKYKNKVVITCINSTNYTDY